MQRTQISLTSEDRRILDAEAARTGRSLSALIREAVVRTYGSERSADDDLRALDAAFGGWRDHGLDGESYVEALRSGRRLDATS
ncbi:MAG: ribbon-helix-helix protein, CopG family [Pseudolysinimonas sp.]|uniref:ribbon-helix-helix protein, CopG family n=1 Tax=Pseudolysinimonas sp. TaxID=2680009 RepID=UPI003C739188